MKTGLESVKSALRAFLDNAAEDLEKTMENLKQGQFTHTKPTQRCYSDYQLYHGGTVANAVIIIWAYWPASIRRRSNMYVNLLQFHYLNSTIRNCNSHIIEITQTLLTLIFFFFWQNTLGWHLGYKTIIIEIDREFTGGTSKVVVIDSLHTVDIQFQILLFLLSFSMEIF